MKQRVKYEVIFKFYQCINNESTVSLLNCKKKILNKVRISVPHCTAEAGNYTKKVHRLDVDPRRDDDASPMSSYR